jgi:hypothetical protein
MVTVTVLVKGSACSSQTCSSRSSADRKAGVARSSASRTANSAIQQTVPNYPQVSSTCTVAQGCYPLAPWAGFAVLCVWAAAALALALFLVRRRDA